MTTEYQPPKVWQWEAPNGGQFANINRPTSGALFEQYLPKGEHDLQLYSMGTPNGVKVTVMLEELLELGIEKAAYDLFLIDIRQGEQFGSDFVAINPNSKIPALLDYSREKPQPVFESGAILLYLAEKFNAFLPSDFSERTECLSWLFWQMASAPYVGGGFGHFYKYAPTKQEYPINRFTLETKRQLDLLNKQLANKNYICGEHYSIADIAIWGWYGQIVLNLVYDAAEFLAVHKYPHLMRWAEQIANRPAVIRALAKEYRPIKS